MSWNYKMNRKTLIVSIRTECWYCGRINPILSLTSFTTYYIPFFRVVHCIYELTFVNVISEIWF